VLVHIILIPSSFCPSVYTQEQLETHQADIYEICYWRFWFVKIFYFDPKIGKIDERCGCSPAAVTVKSSALGILAGQKHILGLRTNLTFWSRNFTFKF